MKEWKKQFKLWVEHIRIWLARRLIKGLSMDLAYAPMLLNAAVAAEYLEDYAQRSGHLSNSHKARQQVEDSAYVIKQSLIFSKELVDNPDGILPDEMANFREAFTKIRASVRNNPRITGMLRSASEKRAKEIRRYAARLAKSKSQSASIQHTEGSDN